MARTTTPSRCSPLPSTPSSRSAKGRDWLVYLACVKIQTSTCNGWRPLDGPWLSHWKTLLPVGNMASVSVRSSIAAAAATLSEAAAIPLQARDKCSVVNISLTTPQKRLLHAQSARKKKLTNRQNIPSSPAFKTGISRHCIPFLAQLRFLLSFRKAWRFLRFHYTRTRRSSVQNIVTQLHITHDTTSCSNTAFFFLRFYSLLLIPPVWSVCCCRLVGVGTVMRDRIGWMMVRGDEGWKWDMRVA